MRRIVLILVAFAAFGPSVVASIAAQPANSSAKTPLSLPDGAQLFLDRVDVTTTVTRTNTVGNGNSVARPIPASNYYQSITSLFSGNTKTALDGFTAATRFGLQTATGRWIDSICYRTMMGECYDRAGQPAAALENYDAAVKLSLELPNWMIGFHLPPTIPLSLARATAPWGQSARATKLGRFPERMVLLCDQNVYDRAGINGGGGISSQTVVSTSQTNLVTGATATTTSTAGPPSSLLLSQQPSAGALYPQGWAFSTNVPEIIRCTTLALKRRHELLGPVCSHDPLSASVAAELGHRVAPSDPCSQAWIDAELGMAYLGVDKKAQAVECLKRAVSLPGNVDHPLTPLVLLELGQLALESGDYKSAENLLAEASYSAYDYGDLDVIEEAFQFGHQAYLMAEANPPQEFPPLAAAIAWSANHGHELHASLLLLAAEDEARLHHTVQAAAALAQAKAALVRRDAANGETGARANWVSAMVDYQQGHTSAGDQAISTALDYEKSGSTWLFQIHQLDKELAGHTDSPLTRNWALPLYESLLRDPSAADWAADPLGSLSAMADPLRRTYETWFDAELKVGPELSLEVADRAKRHHFLSTLPLGGRLTALRWALEAPADSLDPNVLLQRKELLTRYPHYNHLAKQVHAIETDLAAMPLNGAAGQKGAVSQAVADKLNQLARVSAEQESLLREMAVGRAAADIAFPPLRSMKDVQATLTPHHYLFVFFEAHDDLYAWLMSSTRCAAWKINSTAQLQNKIAAFLKAIGNTDANYQLPRAQLADEAWQAKSQEALGALVAGSKVNLGGAIDELVIVPDGVLWYLPFEALEVTHPGGSTLPLMATSQVRYVPTMGLAIPDRHGHGTGTLGIAAGKLDWRDDPGTVAGDAEQLNRAAMHVSTFGKPLPAPAPVFASLFNSLAVIDDLPVAEKQSGNSPWSAYDAWSPIPGDRNRYAGKLAAWLSLPWKKPSQMMLPGFHTPAENSLRQMTPGRPGDDLFLPLCGLMSSGTRTVLISRWRTGGQSSGDLLRQFVQELPYASASDAWQRSVQMLWQTPLELDREPRISRGGGSQETTGRHPIFWSGYILCDTGWSPQKAKKLAAGK